MSGELSPNTGSHEAQPPTDLEPKLAEDLNAHELLRQIFDDPHFSDKSSELTKEGGTKQRVQWSQDGGGFARATRLSLKSSPTTFSYALYVRTAATESTIYQYVFSRGEGVRKITKNDNLGTNETVATTIADPDILRVLRDGYRKTESGQVAELLSSIALYEVTATPYSAASDDTDKESPS